MDQLNCILLYIDFILKFGTIRLVYSDRCYNPCNCIISVDNWNNVQMKKLCNGLNKLFAGFFMIEVLLRYENLLIK